MQFERNSNLYFSILKITKLKTYYKIGKDLKGPDTPVTGEGGQDFAKKVRFITVNVPNVYSLLN